MNAFAKNLDARSSAGRRDLFAAAVIGATAVAVAWDAWADIYRLGRAREELSYVFLAPFVIVWIAWERRRRLEGCPVRGGWAGLVVLAAGGCVSWYGYLADPVLWRGGAVLMAVGGVMAAVGLPAAVRLWPAFVACGFLVPISPDGRYQIAVPLQVATAQVTQLVCDIVGIEVARSGNMLSINGVDVTVAEACNGMRMVFTLLLVCYAVAFTGTSRWYLGLSVLAVSPLVAVVANVVRLVPTVWVFGHFSAQTANQFHDAAGWAMTAIAFFALMAVLRGADWLLTAAPSPVDGPKATPAESRFVETDRPAMAV